VGPLAFGEGWHNNHHAFPRTASQGLRWWQIDFSAYLIVGLERIGLAWDVHRVAPAAQEARRVTPASTV
jgi:stearoyl-CoA desaturase (Delta-9 desaturase)